MDQQNRRRGDMKRRRHRGPSHRGRQQRVNERGPDSEKRHKSSNPSMGGKKEAPSHNGKTDQSLPRSASGITANAVKSLMEFSICDPTTDDNGQRAIDIDNFVVRLRLKQTGMDGDDRMDIEDRTLAATLCDESYCIDVLLMNTRGELTPYLLDGTSNDFIAAVHGAITTEGRNQKHLLQPIICLTSISVLSSIPRRQDLGVPYYQTNPPPVEQNQQSDVPPLTSKVRAGKIGSFLEEKLPFFTNDELISSESPSAAAVVDEPITPPSPSYQDQIQTFLQRHAAMMTLRCSSDLEDHGVQNYTKALEEFAHSQHDRQRASLGTNAGREAADRATLIAAQHKLALERAMNDKKEDQPLSMDLLCQLHSTLLQDLHPEAGAIRTKPVRAGKTSFCSPRNIVDQVNKLCRGLNSLQQRLDVKGNAIHAVLFAAVAMHGVVDIHPFADGNGRLSRIVANWALPNFPFPINLFATPQQRAEYLQALETTRHRLSLANGNTLGEVTNDEVLFAIKATGPFAPIIRLLIDRLGRAVVEFNRVLAERADRAEEALQDRAARMAREQAKQGTCIICLDENPNIATLCCGKAVHLNCIAEWLSGNNSCPYCRGELPSISGRVVRAAGRGVEQRDEDTPDHMPRQRIPTREDVGNARDIIVSLLSSFGTTTEDDDEIDSGNESTTTDMGADEEAIIVNAINNGVMDTNGEIIGNDPESTTEYDPDSTTEYYPDSASENEPNSAAENDNDSADTTYDEGNNDTSSVPLPQPENSRVFCNSRYCRNRPAVDCTNGLCGRCCVLGGQYHCPRHNS